MENYSIVIFIMALMIGLSAIADKIRLPYPVLLIIAGIAVGFIPGLPDIEISPNIVFLIFLPPLLYDAAFNISFKEFQTNINTISSISFMLLMPFLTYRTAEELHVSGVIAVVVLGLGISRFSTKVFPEKLKTQSRSIWDIIIFLLNGLIFILIGLELPYIMKNINRELIPSYVGYAFIITIGALLFRMARVFLQQINLQKAFQKQKRGVSEQALLDFNTSLIISWSGMRGIVSLAIAIGLPMTLTDGSPFPQRNAIIFISVAVVLFTLIGQGLSLPWIVKKLNKQSLKIT